MSKGKVTTLCLKRMLHFISRLTYYPALPRVISGNSGTMITELFFTLLTAPLFLSTFELSKVACVLLERQNPDAVMVLRCSGHDGQFGITDSGFQRAGVVALPEAVTAIRVRLECGLLTEAYLYQKTHCQRVRAEQTKHRQVTGGVCGAEDMIGCRDWLTELILILNCHYLNIQIYSQILWLDLTEFYSAIFPTMLKFILILLMLQLQPCTIQRLISLLHSIGECRDKGSEPILHSSNKKSFGQSMGFERDLHRSSHLEESVTSTTDVMFSAFEGSFLDLPSATREKAAMPVTDIFPLFSTNTED